MAKEINRKGSLPVGWVVRASTKNPDLVYYHNAITGESTWDCPPLDPPRKKRSLDLSSSCEDLQYSNTDKKICSIEDTSWLKTNCGNSPSKNSKLSNISNRVSLAIGSSKAYEMDDSSNGQNVAMTAEFPSGYCQINYSNLDDLEDVEMLDVSQDLQLIDDLPTNTCSSYYIVVDTNIFIHNLKQLFVIQDHNLDDCGPPHIFIPWVVIQELDGLKKDSKLKNFALDGVKYINKMIKAKHPRFHGQSPKEVKDWAQEYSRCNDDRILECCMSLADKMPPDKVVLLTNDINLANKSLICDISAYDLLSFCKKFNVKVLKVSKKSTSTVIKKSVASPIIKKSVASPTVVTKKGNIKTEPVQQSFHSEVVKKESSHSIETENASEKSIRNIMSKARVSLRKVLSAFLTVELNESVGCIWRAKGNISNLTHQLCLLSEYWDSTFSCIFPENGLFNFEYLFTKINNSGALSYETNECATILAIIEDVFSVIKRKRPNINVPIEKIRNNRLKCMQLQLTANKDIVNRFINVASKSDIVLQVLDYNWSIMNNLCGVVMDFYGVQHDFSYDRPTVIPSEAEFDRLMCNLYPSVLQLKQFMGRAMDNSNPKSPPGPKLYKKFCNALKDFVPSLQVDAQSIDTSQLNANILEAFFNKTENKEKISVGYKQIEHFFSKLKEALSVMVLTRKNAC